MTENQMFKVITHRMAELGKTPTSIAKELKRHPSTVRRWLRLKGKIKMSRMYLLLDNLSLKLTMKMKGK
jgi:IS30 family transposase